MTDQPKQAALPQLKKKDGQIYVVEPDGREFFAKLMKLPDDRIVAQYNRIDARTGEVSVQRINLRRKKKPPPPPPPKMPEDERPGLLKKQESMNRSAKSMREQRGRGISDALDDEGGGGSTTQEESVDEEDGEMGANEHDLADFEDEMLELGDLKTMAFEENFSSADVLVMDWLPDEVETLFVRETKRRSMIATTGPAKKQDMESQAFRWTKAAGNAEDHEEQEPVFRDDFKDVEPHEDGVEPIGFDHFYYAQQRTAKPMMNGMPAKFKQIELSKPIELLLPEEKIESIADLAKANDLRRIMYVCLENKDANGLGKSAETEIMAKINECVNVEILIVRHMGLKRVDKLSLPKLLAADLVGNEIKDIKKVVRFCRNSPGLYQLDLRYNDIEKKPVFQPLIAEVLSLHWYSGRVVSDEQRYHAVGRFATDEVKQTFRALKLWEQSIIRVPAVHAMTKWDPGIIKHLKLANLGLQRIFLGGMTSLLSVDVSYNQIYTLQLSGLEKLDHLAAINVSHNKLSKEEDLEIFQWCPALRVIILRENEWPQDYRKRLLWACRNLKGKNHWPGLVEIDAEKVKRSEILKMHAEFGKMEEADVEELKWERVLISFVGHYHLRIPGFTMRFGNLQFPSKYLGHADVSAFGNLQKLDLSDNHLVEVVGLQFLRRLRVLYLQKNPTLNVAATLEQLRKTRSLNDISLAMNESLAKDVLGPYRQNVLVKLFHHAELARIDGEAIGMEERVKAFRLTKSHVTQLDVDTYSLNLKLTMCATKATGRKYLDRDCVPGVQWEQMSVTKLADLTNLNISNKMSDYFWRFSNLQQLNLSNNAITSITAFNLQELQKLEILDVRSNKIRDSIKDMAAYFDAFPALTILCLRDNVTYNSPKHRLDLIGLMQVFKMKTCKIDVMDTVVTVNERITAFKKHGGLEQEVEELRLKFQLHGRLPLNVPQDQVADLVLNRADLKIFLGIMQFVNLKTICMRHNNIKSVLGLEKLKNLQLIDVRDNKLSKLEEVAFVINQLDKLQVFAASNNAFSSGTKSGSKYRSTLIGMVGKLKNIDCTFQFIDDEEVYPDEVVANAFGKPKTASDKHAQAVWIWAANVYRQVQRKGKNTDVTQMDLAFRGISIMEVEDDMFPHLKKLSLAHNKLDTNSLQQLAKIRTLEELDISSNGLNDINAIATLADSLPKLKCLYIDDNPCFKEDIQSFRRDLMAAMQQNQFLNAPMRVLNGLMVTVDERIEGLERSKAHMTPSKLKDFRTELALEAIKARPNLQHIVLSEYKITSLNPLTREYKQIVFLDLSDNKLTTLEEQGLDALPNLLWLDIRRNQFQSLIKSVLLPLTQCHALRHLSVLNSTEKKEETAKVADYLVKPVCHILRGLDSCDETRNPQRMSNSARKGADYIFSTYQIGYNGLTTIDLNQKNLGVDLFPRFCTALSLLHCVKLNSDQNPWKEYPHFRFMLIEFGKSLQEIDGRKVQMAERQNAARIVDSVKLKSKKEFVLDHGSQNHDFKDVALAGGGALAVTAGIGGMAASGAGEDVYAPPVGSWLSKIEIVINWLQTYAILFTLTIHWPNWWFDFNLSWVPVINLELDFEWVSFLASYKYSIQFVVLACLPMLIGFFVLDRFDPEESKWKFYYLGDNAALTNTIHRVDFLFMVLVSIHLGYVADYFYYQNDPLQATSWSRLNDGRMPTEMCTSVILTLIGFVMLINMIRWKCISTFRKKHRSPVYWHNFIRLKKKAALFALTVAYQPICKNVLTSFSKRFYQYTGGEWYLDKKLVDHPECMSSSQLQVALFDEGEMFCCQGGMPNRPCVENLGDLEWYHYMSAVLAIVYVAIIPYALYKAVVRGTSDIDVNFNVPEKLDKFKDRIAQLKVDIKKAGTKMERKQFKKELTKLKKQQKAMWAQYCKEFTNEQNYLYASYTRANRNQKVKTMLEKCLLLMVTLYFSSQGTREYKPMLGFIVIIVFFMSLCVQQPFNDVIENMMDLMCRFSNVATAFIGIIAEEYYSEHYKDGIGDDGPESFALAVVNMTCVIIIALCFLAMPGRMWWSRRVKRKAAERQEIESHEHNQETEKAAEFMREQTHRMGQASDLNSIKVGEAALRQEQERTTARDVGKRTSVLKIGNIENSELARKANRQERTENPEECAAYDTSGGKDALIARLKTSGGNGETVDDIV